jgi:chaperonin cofactor prefoldin
MEAVGAASSIAGLVNLADVVISHGLRYIKEAKDANNTITSLLIEVTSLRSTLNQVEYVMGQFQQAQLEFKIAVQSHNDLESAKKTLSEIQVCLHENLPSEADNPLKSLGRRLLWPFKSSETKELTAKIERHKSAINLLVGTEGW